VNDAPHELHEPALEVMVLPGIGRARSAQHRIGELHDLAQVAGRQRGRRGTAEDERSTGERGSDDGGAGETTLHFGLPSGGDAPPIDLDRR
jgi:hypothetical protein